MHQPKTTAKTAAGGEEGINPTKKKERQAWIYSRSPFLILKLRVLEKAGSISKDGNRQEGEGVGAALAVENRVQTLLLPSPVSSDASPLLIQPELPETSLHPDRRGSLRGTGGAWHLLTCLLGGGRAGSSSEKVAVTEKNKAVSFAAVWCPLVLG